MPEDHYTSDADIPKGPLSVEDARRAHHLASADPDGPDGTLTGPEHDAKYGLARAAGSRADWASAHDGNPDGGRDTEGVRTADAPAPVEATVPPAPVAPKAA